MIFRYGEKLNIDARPPQRVPSATSESPEMIAPWHLGEDLRRFWDQPWDTRDPDMIDILERRLGELEKAHGMAPMTT
jgi:hypothetical protein